MSCPPRTGIVRGDLAMSFSRIFTGIVIVRGNHQYQSRIQGEKRGKSFYRKDKKGQ
jgi:hypothetical protein